MIRSVKMIVTDLDRTLLGKDKGLSEYTKSIINKCRQNGIMFVFATARPERATSHFQIGISPSYVIANNGATIMSDRKCIQNIPIPEKIKNDLISQFSNEKSISFGDDYNDVEMIKKCGIGVAVGNAITHVKVVADFICDRNDNDGVAKCIEQYVLCAV